MKWLAIALFMVASPLWAVQPDEILTDPVLEARAREISVGLRCPVCLNENIDDSNAAVARDLRILVRERLVAGDSNAQVVDYLVHGKPGEFAGFGEFILLNPPAKGATIVLWLTGPLALLLALWGGWVAVVSRRPAAQPLNLSDDEQARLDQILKS